MKTIWGIEGGDLDKHPMQTHLSVGGSLRFYFTIAARAFGGFVRLRLMGTRPFVQVRSGSMDTPRWA